MHKYIFLLINLRKFLLKRYQGALSETITYTRNLVEIDSFHAASLEIFDRPIRAKENLVSFVLIGQRINRELRVCPISADVTSASQ